MAEKSLASNYIYMSIPCDMTVLLPAISSMTITERMHDRYKSVLNKPRLRHGANDEFHQNVSIKSKTNYKFLNKRTHPS